MIDLSVGASRAPDTVRSAVAYAIGKGVIVVAAAGNEGQSEAFYPASYPGVISVAGVDETSSRYSWSNFGSWVTVAAPGCTSSTWLGGGTVANFCGTSTAAPYVAGVAGLARSSRKAPRPLPSRQPSAPRPGRSKTRASPLMESSTQTVPWWHWERRVGRRFSQPGLPLRASPRSGDSQLRSPARGVRPVRLRSSGSARMTEPVAGGGLRTDVSPAAIRRRLPPSRRGERVQRPRHGDCHLDGHGSCP